MWKKLAVLLAFLIIAVIFQPLINGFISRGIFYLQKPDIIVKKDSEKITRGSGAPQYDEISHQALGLIFSHNNVYSQMEHALMLVHVGHVETAPHAQNRSYVQLPINSPLNGKRIYVLLIDSSDPRGGEEFTTPMSRVQERIISSKHMLQKTRGNLKPSKG